MAQRLSHRSLPLALLAVLSLLSFAARAAWLGEPCRAPCRSATDHVLVFDETYYVNAARVIAGIMPPRGSPYLGAPLGDDPNAEHPQLAKLAMAGGIELFGDGPLAWRLPSLLFGSLAIAGMFALVRAAGGGRWTALGAAALMASDNLLIVHGRIGTLDVYVLAAMIWAAVMYLRDRPLVAGALVGIAATFKLVGPYVLLVLALYELLRRRRSTGPLPSPARAAARLAGCAATAVAVLLGLLALLDHIAPPYDMTAGRPLRPGPFHHLAHMLSYAAKQTSPHGPRGIASYPWQWIVDLKPIVYLNINPPHPSRGLHDIQPQVHFLGMVSPPIMLLAAPALLLIAWSLLGLRRRRPVPGRDGVRAGAWLLAEQGQVGILGLAWSMGTFLPFLALSLLWQRTSYLYYMVVVMPGIYLAVAQLLFAGRRYRRLVGVWALSVLIAAVVMYPLTPGP